MRADRISQFSGRKVPQSTAERLGASVTWDPRLKGACVGSDPEMWFPHPTDPTDQAKAICSGCPLRDQCLDIGVRRKEWGIWGGVLLESGKPVKSRVAA